MTWITTFTGKHFDFAAPAVEGICIEDIAQALSHECRFAGHLQAFYSVAQHCVLASHLVPAEFALEALLHDATEAYCKDIPAPLKRLLPDYQAIEDQVDAIIRLRFGLPLTKDVAIKYADLVMLATERRDLVIHKNESWPMLEGIPAADFAINPLPPAIARTIFMQRFHELTNTEVRSEQ